VAGANKPDGKSNTQRVSFTRRDADRIGRVVRTVEAGDKKGNALTFRRAAVSSAGGVLRIATHGSAAWNKDSTQTVTFVTTTSTPQDSDSSQPVLRTLPAALRWPLPIAIARDGTAWHLICSGDATDVPAVSAVLRNMPFRLPS
jgi:hypothetical protein